MLAAAAAADGASFPAAEGGRTCRARNNSDRKRWSRSDNDKAADAITNLG